MFSERIQVTTDPLDRRPPGALGGQPPRAFHRDYPRLLGGVDGCEQADPPVTKAHQVGDGIMGSGLIVDHDAVAVKLRKVTVEQYHRHALRPRAGEVTELGDGRWCDDKAIDLLLQQRPHCQLLEVEVT